jgi:hypothetical protein
LPRFSRECKGAAFHGICGQVCWKTAARSIFPFDLASLIKMPGFWATSQDTEIERYFFEQVANFMIL